jgi:chemotaxis protein methyltransferase CheR
MQPEDYQFLCQILAEGSGLTLGPGKEYLVESRLTPLTATLGVADIPGLVKKLRASRDRGIERTVCEAMTTNESLFFRDGAPFEILKRRVFPELAGARRAAKRLKIWSAASSTGQEAYSIAMSLAVDAPMLTGYQVEILGTDLSRATLERAKSGVFTHFEVQRGLPIAMLTKFFAQVREGWQIKEDIRKQVVFRELNLLHDFSSLGVFDVIFCRNVLIYFDTPTKAQVLAGLARVLAPDGYLFLGGAETVMGISEAFARLEGEKTSVYRCR